MQVNVQKTMISRARIPYVVMLMTSSNHFLTKKNHELDHHQHSIQIFCPGNAHASLPANLSSKPNLYPKQARPRLSSISASNISIEEGRYDLLGMTSHRHNANDHIPQQADKVGPDRSQGNPPAGRTMSNRG